MNILVVDDMVTIVSILRTTLTKKGHTVQTARDGREAAEILKQKKIDCVLTDLLMPNMDGIGLIRWIRENVTPPPPIIMITTLESVDARIKALDAGADAYLVKPIQPDQLIEVVTDIEQKKFQSVSRSTLERIAMKKTITQHYPAVGIAAGTSGATAIREIFRKIKHGERAAFFVVLHGPGWASEALADQIQMETSLPVVIPSDREQVAHGTIYVAPGDRHMTVAPDGRTIQLTTSPPENYLRPSADPLFRSLAAVFGPNATGVVLGGTGCDASVGSAYIRIAEGTVIAQDPAGSVSPQMLTNIVAFNLAHAIVPLGTIADKISHRLGA